ncbi:MAG: type VI secretion system baseplate subunit TssK [Proteobacteria bacterium]|nr:type VI secretion system baseplate subunit TssK [Pseudomonadota bacterium]
MSKYRIIPAVQWHEGMLLMPEHFQQHGRRTEQLLHFHMSHATPFYWGMETYKLDAAKLVSGIVSFTSLSAVMPDGTVVILGEQEGAPLEIDVTSYMKQENATSVTVYLAIPTYRPGAANVDNDLPRYLSRDSEEVVDENTGEGRMRFATLRPNLLLLTGEEPSGQYVSFPVLQIDLTGNSYSLASDFTPASLLVTIDHPLGKLCMELAQRMRQKISFLSDRLSDKTGGGDVLSSEAEDAVKALSRGLLSFEAILRAGASHPFALYLKLCDLAGNLTELHPGQMPPSFGAYAHNNLMPSFLEVTKFVGTMLDQIQEGYTTVPMILSQRIFKLPLRQSWMQERLVFGAKASSTMDEKAVAQWLSAAVIATDRFVGEVRDKRILGAVRVVVESDEDLGLLPARGVVLFSVTYDRSFIDATETLQIFNVADTDQNRPQEIVMYVPKRTRNTYF